MTAGKAVGTAPHPGRTLKQQGRDMTLKRHTFAVFLTVLCAWLPITASAVPWCHRGKIAVVSNQSWDGPTILSHFTPSAANCASPPVVSGQQEHCKTFSAITHFAQALSGGSPGKLCRVSIPGVMTTRAIATAPQSYLVGGAYAVGQGVVFRVEKCFCNSIDAAQPLPR